MAYIIVTLIIILITCLYIKIEEESFLEACVTLGAGVIATIIAWIVVFILSGVVYVCVAEDLEKTVQIESVSSVYNHSGTDYVDIITEGHTYKKVEFSEERFHVDESLEEEILELQYYKTNDGWYKWLFRTEITDIHYYKVNLKEEVVR